MAAQDFYIKKGDTKDDLQVTLKDANDAAVDVTGATIKFSMRRKERRTLKVNEGTVTIVTAGSGVVKYEWQSGETGEAGEFLGEFEVTYSGGGIQTFPNNKADELRIHITDEFG